MGPVADPRGGETQASIFIGLHSLALVATTSDGLHSLALVVTGIRRAVRVAASASERATTRKASLVAQGLDRVELGGLAGRIEAEEHTDDRAEGHSDDDRGR